MPFACEGAADREGTATLPFCASGGLCSRVGHERSGVDLLPGSVQVYVDGDACAVVRYAAQELGDALSKVLGRQVPVTNVFLSGYTAVSVGDNAFSRKAGIDVAKLPRDAGVIKTADGRIYIAGRDDGRVDSVERRLTGGILANMYERATLFAVYEFLERFAGVRFYFPGELGTVTPRKSVITVPARDILNAPANTHRNYSAWADGAWFAEGGRTNRVVQHYRNRLQTEYIPCSHGLNELFYLKRFGASHPEYFQMKADGTRNVDPKYPQPGQLCHTSGIWEEIYKDVRSYFLGEDPSIRAVPAAHDKPGFRWNCNMKEIPGLGKFADIMPQDAFQECHCKNCQAAYRKDCPSYATDLVWRQVAKVGFRLKEEGIPGTITMMGYFPYAEVPSFPLPDNLMVMVARMGPWSKGSAENFERDEKNIRDWSRKIGKKVWLWNYPCKFRGEFPDIPEHAPRAWAGYYKDLAPHIFGAYAQTHSTRWLYNHLNNYVFGKVMWKPDTDVDQLLDEYYRLMFGAGARPMKSFFESLERLWMKGVVGKTAETPLGPIVVRPGEYDLYTRIYSPAKLAKIGSALDAAAEAVEPSSLEARRIALMRREIFEPMRRRAARYIEGIDVPSAIKRRAGEQNRSILVNGDFRQGNGGWLGKWELDLESTVDGKPSCKVVSTKSGNDAYQPLAEGMQRLKPSTRYRFSYFLKIKDVVPVRRRGGVYGNVYAGGNLWFPKFDGHTGSSDWMFQCFEFTTSPETNVKYRSYVSLRILNAKGTAWFSDVRLEELPPEK